MVTEAVNLDPSPSQMMQAHAPDAAGAHLEVAFLSSGNAMRAQDNDGLTQRGPSGLLCAAFCQAKATPQMPGLDLTLVRFRQPQNLSEPWVTPDAALAAVLAALELQIPVPRGKAAPPSPAAPTYAAGGGSDACSYGPQPAHECGRCGRNTL